MRKVRYLGLDVHAETIAVAIAEPNGEVRSVGVIANRPEAVRRLVKQLGAQPPMTDFIGWVHAGRPEPRWP